jgi:thioredoxin reductase (NADPH)
MSALETPALIVGAGPVGLFQVFQLGLLGIPCHVVDALPHAGGQCAELYPGKPIYDIPGVPATTGRGLVESLVEQIKPFTTAGTAQLHWGQLVSTVARQDDGRFRVGTDTGLVFTTQTLIIAAGAGAFVPRKLRVDGLEALEGKQVFYPDSDDIVAYAEQRGIRLGGQNILIQGDDDRALGWALDLTRHLATAHADAATLRPASVTLLHRRDAFSAVPALVARIQQCRDDGRLRFIAGQITRADTDCAEVNSAGRLHAVQLAKQDGTEESLPVDVVLASLGVSPKLGPIADWGLDLLRKQIPVDTEKFQTLEPGIFAIGDINTYPGKKKLIVCGFHECVLAAFGVAEIVFPGKPQLLQYTTTSTRLHALLGVTH